MANKSVTKIWLLIIGFYQRALSPHKGFHCAHHHLYGRQTCSNAIKDLIAQRGLIGAWPDIKRRLRDCRHAYSVLVNNGPVAIRDDLACDAPCDVSIGECGTPTGGGSSCDASSCVDAMPCDLIDFSRRTWKRIIIVTSIVAVIATYWLYGRQVVAVTIVDQGSGNQGLLDRVLQRQQPELRVLIENDGRRYYSEVLAVDPAPSENRLTFSNGPRAYQLDQIKILDARINLGGETLVVGQVLETFDNPATSGVGKRFEFRLQRRWHFL